MLAELGRGTTGVVYKARCRALNRVVALKMPLLGSPAQATVRCIRFRREAQALARLTWDPDPDFPTLHEVGEHGSQPYLVREFVEGSTLEELVAAGALKLRQGIGILAAVAGAVQRVHDRGIAHRNLHAANVLVGRDGAPKLIGFGHVELLEGSDMLPPGGSGVPADLDVQDLQELLGWLAEALGEPLPQRLEAIRQDDSVDSAASFAEALRNC
jgi:eukaryotic-like serine/threonine-protein kinase